MAQERRLGKGLGALLGESAVESVRADRSGQSEIEIDRIAPNRYQPRRSFDDESIADLAASIAAKGVLQPLIVTPRAEGDYMLVSGERRLRASREAGLSTVPVIVRDLRDRDLLEIALIENLQREDLDPIDEAEGYHRLADEFDLTQAEIGEVVGRSRPAIANALRLLELPDRIQAMIKAGDLSAGHGRGLLGLNDRNRIPAVAQRAVAGGWSVRQLEEAVRTENGEKKRRAAKRARTSEDAERGRLEETLQRALGTRVRIRADGKGRGRIELAFYSLEDLERLVEKLEKRA